MRDSIDDDDIDRAYRMAVETTTDVAVVRRRRGAVLEAVEGLDAVHETPVDRHSAAPDDRTAANEAHRHPSATWWRGVAAACVIGTSALVVVHMQQAPEATVETELRSDADRVAAPAPAGESTAARVAEAVPRQSGRRLHPTRTRDRHRRAPTRAHRARNAPGRSSVKHGARTPSRRRRDRRSLAMASRPRSRAGASHSPALQPVPWMPHPANLRWRRCRRPPSSRRTHQNDRKDRHRAPSSHRQRPRKLGCSCGTAAVTCSRGGRQRRRQELAAQGPCCARGQGRRASAKRGLAGCGQQGRHRSRSHASADHRSRC